MQFMNAVHNAVSNAVRNLVQEALLPMTKDTQYSYQMQGIVQMTAEYAKDYSANTTNLPKAAKAKLTSLLSAHGSPIDGTVRYATARDSTVRNMITGKADSRAAQHKC